MSFSQTVPLVLTTEPDVDYALIDSGRGRKLERYGPYQIIRPEAQALWDPVLAEDRWLGADAEFTGNIDEEGMGRWRFKDGALSETWPMKWQGLHYLGRFTSFRHVGVFPEQAAHWRHLETIIKKADRPVRLLNLFGYTGVASLVAAQAGAQVTHVDASKKAMGWARENQVCAGLEDKPIRWICDDAVKFCQREVRRGKQYEAVLLDPPKYGRGPKGEIWQLFDDLPLMIELVSQLLSSSPVGVILTAYSIRASFFTLHELMADRFQPMGGLLESGELVLHSEAGDRRLSTSLFSRWSPV